MSYGIATLGMKLRSRSHFGRLSGRRELAGPLMPRPLGVLMNSTVARLAAAAVTIASLGGCGIPSGRPAAAGTTPDWTNIRVHAVSEIAAHAGVVAVTSMDGRQQLRTVVLDKTTGNTLWSQPATMAGRPPRLGVGPPAVVPGPEGDTLVVAIEPGGPTGAALVGRGARSGGPRWRAPVTTSYGPQRCGPYICISDDDYVYMRSPESGEIQWRAGGPAAVAASSAGSAVFFHWGDRPAVQKRDLDTGALLWEVAVGRILGPGVDARGGWRFSQVSGVLVGYLGPFGQGSEMTPFGYFGLRLSDGALLWRHERMLAVHPAPPAESLLLAQRVTNRGTLGDYAVIAPRTGSLTGSAPASGLPRNELRVAISGNTEMLGLYRTGRAGRSFALDSGHPASDGDTRMWTYCDGRQEPLEIRGRHGYGPITPLCPVDLSTGHTLAGTGLPPPEWYSGRASGWRIWPGPQGELYGRHVGQGNSAGLYLVPTPV